MTLLSEQSLAAYWSLPMVEANIVIFMNLLGALFLGLLVGYERSYHGRAAGMRTYGLVCLASAGLTVIVGYPELWFGGHSKLPSNPDVTRVIQGIVTGIGFLCSGVIIKEGFTISGLTTAASIWLASTIGVLVGVGFYGAAILLSVLSALVMMWITKLENWLPARHAISIALTYQQGFEPTEQELQKALSQYGYAIAKGTFMIQSNQGKAEWSFAAISQQRQSELSIPEISQKLSQFNGVENFHVSFARN
ncbi:putative Mg(2+) transport ATPase [mine drainage metagenome]|uniref:Putative Mg(2+) transport ATPase n=1 Tax=mine drainage metagenome TaxID=410659 RepID=A0A1J5T9M9_9ZZZZ